jgi:hypothetical protein
VHYDRHRHPKQVNAVVPTSEAGPIVRQVHHERDAKDQLRTAGLDLDRPPSSRSNMMRW